MGSDNRPEIVLDGDISPFRQKMREAAASLKQLGSEGENAVGRMTGPLKGLQERFVAIGALLAGGAVFREAVQQTVTFTEESTKLGRALGDSASEASILREALTAGNTSQEEFLTASKGMAKQLRENEGTLQSMGLVTRDAAGQLRPLNDLTLEGIEIVNKYRAGTDRAVAGQTMFGKGFEMTSNLALMNKQAVAEVAEQMRALGIVASVESVAAWQAFDDAGDKAGLTLKGIQITIGNALMPVLTDLGNWFASVGPAAVTVIRGAFGGLAATFHLLTTGVTVLWETINAMVVTVTEPIRAMASSLYYIAKGEFGAAAEELKNIPATIGSAWGNAFDEMAAKAEGTRDRIWKLFAEGTPTGKPDGGGKSATGLLKKDKDKDDPSNMAKYEAALAARKNAFEQENVLRQFSKDQELAYWREIQKQVDVTAKDRIAIAKRTATLEVEIRRKAAKEQQELNSAMVDHRRAEGLAQIQMQEQQARYARENGVITKSELVTQEEEFARRRFEIEYQAQLERLELAKNDPNASPAALMAIKEQMLEIERNYQLRKGELGQDKKKADGTGGLFDDIGASFGSAADSMLSGARSLQQGLAGIFQSIYQSFLQNLITKPLGEWIASQARMLAVKMGFISAEKGLETAAAAATVGIKTAETTAVVAADAAQAGAGAAASQASIPIVGPGMALAAMAAVFAAVMALGNRKSAARGYDIPKGINPVVQTHEEEMILPQKYANVIRGMARGDGTDSGGGGGELHIHARSDNDVVRVGDMKKLLTRMNRNFVVVK